MWLSSTPAIRQTPMSKESGRVQRAIEALFKSKPNDAFATWEICWRVYPNVGRLESKHKLAVTRAAKRVCARMPDWQSMKTWYRGGELVFFKHASVKSYGLARRKSECRYASDKQIRASLRSGGDHHRYVVEGGTWWRHVQLYIADREPPSCSIIVADTNGTCRERRAARGRRNLRGRR